MVSPSSSPSRAEVVVGGRHGGGGLQLVVGGVGGGGRGVHGGAAAPEGVEARHKAGVVLEAEVEEKSTKCKENSFHYLQTCQG